MLGIIGTMMAAEQAKDRTEEAVLDLTRKMCKEIGMNVFDMGMEQIKALLLIKDMKFFRFSKLVDDKPTIFINIIATDKLVQAGKVTVNVEMLDTEDDGEMELKVEIQGRILNEEGLEKMNAGFGEWLKKHETI